MADNPNAFPSQQAETQDGSWNQTYDPGMTLRDWFAGQAIAGFGANPDYLEHLSGQANRADMKHEAALAQVAFTLADAMLAARVKRPA